MAIFLNEKCTPSALPEIYAPRSVLMDKMRKAASGRFVYIGAPAGSGKTVTALLYTNLNKAKANQQNLWISLDAYDNIPSVFYKLLSSVICSTQPDNENMQAILEDPAFSSSPAEFTVRLLAELWQDKNHYILTLDDLHLITSADILKSLPAVIKRLPLSFTVLFLSRNELPQEFKGLFKNENISILGAAELRFSETELKQHYKNLGWNLTEEETGFVLMASGGLAINVNAIAKSGHIEPEKKEYAFEAYIRQHLWKTWDKDIRNFMLTTSIVDEMSAEFAAALTNRKDTPELLQKLCTNNTFVSRAGKDIYRYHHLFLAFLRTMAKELNTDLTAAHKNAANYFLKSKQYLMARLHAVLSGNEQTILKVIIEFNQYTNPFLDDYVAFAKLYNSNTLTEAVCERYPYLYTSQLEAAWVSGDSESSEYYWDKLNKHLPTIALKFPQLLETVILETVVDYRKSLNKLMSDYSLLPPIVRMHKRYQVSTLSLQLPFIHRSIRDLSEFADKGALKKLDQTFGLFLKELYKVVRPCMLAGILLEQNQIKEALSSAIQGKELMAEINDPEIKFCAYNHLSAVYLASGKETLLKESLAETEKYIERSGARFLERNFLAFKTKIRLMDAEKSAAESWLENYFVTEEDNVPLYKIYQYFTTLRAYIVLSKGAKASALIDRIIKFANAYRRPLDLAEAKTLKACLDWVAGSRTEAVSNLEESLLELQGRSLIRIVADEGAAVLPILKRISTIISSDNYSGSLNRVYVTEVLLAAHDMAKQYKGITAVFKKSGKPVKLSKQQKKMVDLLAKGYKNQEIAKITGLAVPTVKGHLMQAYEKLGVHNSMDALLKMRELGL